MRHGLVGFDLDLYLDALLQLHFVAIAIDQAVGDANFARQVIRTLDSDLSFLGFSAAGVRVYDFFDFSGKRGAGLSFFRRHDWDPPLNSNPHYMPEALTGSRRRMTECLHNLVYAPSGESRSAEEFRGHAFLPPQ